ncbi:glucose-6-phosphate dehydrogenase assembly protein OpcA [Yinghuangia seranimata]|uniref:glucose-6-phosphate dehydrogenase assembly protein OpcA n=1 Tax=Yinghuangia seranimata TaxID=408067 RepID=UPI00248C7DB4|nr:glucose-6-phosphate dehydrogenase assembly protein OpcA [Yinghuangia seranimata]MDI2126324.1 glucose-6-phosphate dehydrogenase assembly protein OpcA [Yinghuangia seranimata]
MMIDLTDTKSSAVNAALVDARHAIGSPALGMVLTLVIVTDESNQYDAMKAATEAAREHPSRILVVIGRPGADITPRLDAEVRVGDVGAGETVVLRLHGELAEHAESVVLPLLLPDAPVVVWWPGAAPETASKDPLGVLAQRRITDAVAAPRRPDWLEIRASGYVPGDTDLAWTRTTTWRSLLAAALDQRYEKISSAAVEAKAGNPSAELLALWLSDRLGVPVERVVSAGPGITAVKLVTVGGDIAITRPDGVLATLTTPGQPDRHVALKRRDAAELIAEELRRLDPDDVYAATLAHAAHEARNTASTAAKQAEAHESATVAVTAVPGSSTLAESADEAAKPATTGRTGRSSASSAAGSRSGATAAKKTAKRTAAPRKRTGGTSGGGK